MKPRLFDLDFQLIHDAALTLIAVFVLYLALSYFLFDPVRELLKKRQEKIVAELENASNTEKDAKALQEAYENKLADIEKEAEQILGGTRKRALAGENQILAEAKEEARRIMDRARVEAGLTKSKIADEIKTEMIELAAAMAGKVVAVHMSADMQKRLLEETLKEMGEDTWRR